MKGPHVAGAHGIVWLLAAVACYGVMDALTRVVGPSVGVPFLMVIRFAIHLAAMAAWLALRRLVGDAAPVHATPFSLQLVRGVALFASSALAVLSLQRMPVAEYTAVVLLTPLWVLVVAWAWLKQTVTSRQWTLLAMALTGALIVIRPGSGLFDVGALFALGVVACNTLYQSISNQVGAREDAITTNFHSGWIGLGLSMLWWMQAPAHVAPDGAALPHAASVVWGLAAIGLLATLAQWMLLKALAHTPAARLMPFVYAQIAFAALAGWLLSGDVPDTWGWVGMAVIAASGVLSAVPARQTMQRKA